MRTCSVHKLLPTCLLGTLVAFSSVSTPPAQAATTLLFEDFESAGNRGVRVVSGWARSGTGQQSSGIGIESYSSLGSRIDDPTPYGGGAYLHYINSSSESIYRVLTDTLQANTTYILSAYAVDRTNLGFQTSSLRLGYVSGTDDGSTGDLVANHFFGENLLTPTSVVNPTPVNGAGSTDGYQLWTYTFETGASPGGLGNALRVEVVGSGIQSLFDNIRLEAVPEPGSLALFAVTGLSLLLRRRRDN